MNNSKRIALIPAYEPDEKMLALAKELKIDNFEMVFVNDGSGEDKNEIFREAATYGKVLVHEVNKGKGEAIKTGLKYICENFFAPYVVVTVDADGQHKVKDAIRVCEVAEGKRNTLVLGSRKFTGKVPLRSRLGNTITRLVYRLTSGMKVYDTQTGLRGFSDSLMGDMLNISGSRYEYEMNVLMTFAKGDKPIEEVWIDTVYLDENASSHFDTVKDSYRIYKEIIKFSGSSLASFFVDYGLYCLLLGTSGNLVMSNVLARIVSGSMNYAMNRRMVFGSNVPLVKSSLQYIALSVFILAVNTLLLNQLTVLGMGAYVAKIIVEMTMFVFSWFVQHQIIFKG
ncbi:MAG: bifunctional glycosyltransferase family 2/GtrA family protein [Firmicutes bacterium]|nr:bifunctional glycosyltransferase family 2/GtrA family protein [Bacillota bacterium]